MYQKASITSYFRPTNFFSGLDAVPPGDLRSILLGEAFGRVAFYFSKCLRELMRMPFISLPLVAKVLGLWFSLLALA
jgi:hypothetical protein